MSSSGRFRRGSSPKVRRERPGSLMQPPASPSRFPKLVRVGAHLAQIFTLFVLAGGYFYTVLPVFEKQKISEELAKLQIEQESWSRKIDEAQNELRALKVAKKSLERALSDLQERRNEAVERQAAAESEAARLAARSDSLQRTITRAERKLYQLQKSQLLGTGKLPPHFIALVNSTVPGFDREEIADLSENLKASYPSPLEIAQAQVEAFEEAIGEARDPTARKSLAKLLADFQNGIKSNGQILICPNPGFDTWRMAFAGSFPLEDKLIDECVEMHFEHQAAEQGWSDREVRKLRKSKFWSDQSEAYENICSFSLPRAVELYFHKRWMAVVEPCRERVEKLASIVLGDTLAPDLSPFRSVAPPTKSEIDAEVRRMIAEWHGS